MTTSDDCGTTEAVANTTSDDGLDVLYLVHRVPFPPNKGERIRALHVLKYLSRRSRVHLACLADESVDGATRTALGELCERLAIVPLPPRGRWLRALASLAAGCTATEGAFDSPSLRTTLRRWAGETRFHAAVASASSMVPYLRMDILRDVPAVIDLVDVDSQKWLDYAAAGSGPKSWLHRIEGQRLRRLEHSLPDWARAVTLVSEEEADLFRRIRASNAVHVMTVGIDTEYLHPQPGGEESGCVFIGSLDYPPNIDGITWFCREVWPAIRSRCPQATVSLVGRRPTPQVRRLDDLPGVELVGPVSDVRPYLRRAAVAIAPLRIARGVQCKVLEAFAMGKAVVASPQALMGLRIVPGVQAMAARSHDEWINAVSTLLGDRGLRMRLGEASRRHVETHHRWDLCQEPIGILLGLTAGASTPPHPSLALDERALPPGVRAEATPNRSEIP